MKLIVSISILLFLGCEKAVVKRPGDAIGYQGIVNRVMGVQNDRLFSLGPSGDIKFTEPLKGRISQVEGTLNTDDQETLFALTENGLFQWDGAWNPIPYSGHRIRRFTIETHLTPTVVALAGNKFIMAKLGGGPPNWQELKDAPLDFTPNNINIAFIDNTTERFTLHTVGKEGEEPCLYSLAFNKSGPQGEWKKTQIQAGTTEVLTIASGFGLTTIAAVGLNQLSYGNFSFGGTVLAPETGLSAVSRVSLNREKDRDSLSILVQKQGGETFVKRIDDNNPTLDWTPIVAPKGVSLLEFIK